MRVLLLARAAGDWGTRLARDLDGEPGQVTALEPLDPVGDRAAQFTAAVAAFADRLDDAGTGEGTAQPHTVLPPSDLGDDRYGSPLNLQLAALTAVLQRRQPLTGVAADFARRGHAAAP
ncbi:MAG TPA: hypothetical protein VMU34_00865 [Mycobacterium sp.]|nr:hypothetical protein [Mycobacterium sp.]